MEDGELSEDSGGRHPAEDLIIQKALRRAAAAEASSSDLLSPLAPHDGQARCIFFYLCAGPAMPPGLQLSVDAKQQPPLQLGGPEGSREGSAAPNGEPTKKKRKKKPGARAKEEVKAAMAQNLERHLARLNGSADAAEDGATPAEAHVNTRHAGAARDPADMDAMSLHSSDSEEAGIAFGNAPDLARGAKRRKVVAAPVGVRVINDDEEAGRAPEMQRLLRQPRYFDEDFEAAGQRCFKCGGQGHIARDCPNEARPRPCYLCAQLGHTRAQCTNAMCYTCQQPGHMARDCPNGRPTAAPVCLRCGRKDCPAAEGDYIRAEGGCIYDYRLEDLAQAVCLSCGELGHLCCAPACDLPPYEASCYNCGQAGHTGEACWMDRTMPLQMERRNQRRSTASTGSGGRSDRMSYDDAWAAPSAPSSNGREEDGDRYGRWQGEYSNSHRGDYSNSHSGGSSYAQRVSRLSARTGSSGERSQGERSRSEHRREHLRWEDYSDDEDQPLPPKPQHSRRYGRR